MKALALRYERLAKNGSFAHVKVGVEYVVEMTETPEQVLAEARKFVDDAIAFDQRRCKAEALAAKARAKAAAEKSAQIAGAKAAPPAAA